MSDKELDKTGFKEWFVSERVTEEEFREAKNYLYSRPESQTQLIKILNYFNEKEKEKELVEEKPERPQQNPKIYKPKEVMEHLLKGGWVEIRDYTNASYYKYLNNDGYLVNIFKKDDERVCKIDDPYGYGLGLTHFELEYRKYFLIKPLTDNELRTLGRQGVDV